MSDQDTNLPEVDDEGNPIAPVEDIVATAASDNDAETQKLISDMATKMVEEQLAPIKEKLGNLYKERDVLATRASKAEEEAKQAEIKRLEDDGKDLEAANLKVSAMQGQLDALRSENTSLTRDRIVSDATMTLDFRNESAKAMAVNEITNQLVQGEDGVWKHKSGVPIKDFVEHYAKDDDKIFLFKPKNSSGSGTMAPGTPPSTGSKPEFLKKPTSEWTGEEMMVAIRDGHLGGGTLSEQMAASYI